MTLTVNRAGAIDKLPGVVVFDLDDTLYGYAGPHEAALTAVESKLLAMLNISASAFRAGFGTARDKVKKRLGNTAGSHSRLLYFQQMLEDLGLRTQTLLALDIEHTYWRAFLDAARLFPKAEELLMEFQAGGVRMVIVTDLTAQIQFRKIVHFGLDRYIDFVVTSEEAGQDKVGLAPFHLVADKLALGKDTVVWSIGDQRPDLDGASEVLGAVTIQKTSPGAVQHAADASFSDYADLLRHVQRVAGRSIK